MVQITKLTSAVVAAGLFASAAAHPGEHHDHHHIKREISARHVRAAAAKRSLDNCNSAAKHQALNARSYARRAQVAHELREKRGIAESECCFISCRPSQMLTIDRAPEVPP